MPSDRGSRLAFECWCSSRFFSLVVFWSNVIWSFSFNLNYVYCLLVFSCLLYQSSLIMILVPGCYCKLYVGHTQSWHTYLLPLQAWGRTWWCFRLGVHFCWRQLIFFLDLKYPSISSPNTSFFDCWPVYFEFTGSVIIDLEICTQVWLKIVYGQHTNWTYRFASPAGFWGVLVRYIVVLFHF